MFAGFVHGFFRHVGSGAAASCLKHPETRSEDSRCFDESCLMFRMEQPVVFRPHGEKDLSVCFWRRMKLDIFCSHLRLIATSTLHLCFQL